jgi:hypothetical protein
MKRPENRMESRVQDPPVETRVEPPPKPAEVRGIPCPFCKVVGKNYVAQTRIHGIRERVCFACKRRFVTKEIT